MINPDIIYFRKIIQDGLNKIHKINDKILRENRRTRKNYRKNYRKKKRKSKTRRSK